MPEKAGGKSRAASADKIVIRGGKPLKGRVEVRGRQEPRHEGDGRGSAG